MEWWGVVKVIIYISALIGLIKANRFKKKRMSLLQQRPSLTFDEFYEKYYAQTRLNKDTVRFLLMELSKALDVPQDKLLPTDKFNEELAPKVLKTHFNNKASDFLEKVKDRTKHLKINEASALYETLDQYLRLFGNYRVDELTDPWDLKVIFKKAKLWIKSVFADERI